MNKNELERVEGISRFHEMMWIERKNGNIKQLYDWHYNEIENQMLHRSYISVATEKGFTYKGEFIPLENVNEVSRKRALGHQRHTREHDISLKM